MSLLGSRNLRANTRKEDSASIAETCFREVNDVNVCFNTCYLCKASEFCCAEDCFFLLLGWENSGGKIGCSAGVGATSRLWRSAGGILRGVLGLAFRPADRKSPKKFRIHTLKTRFLLWWCLMHLNAFECIWCHWPPALLALARLIQTCLPADYPRWHCHRHLRCKGPGKLAQSALPWNISFWDCLKAWRACLILSTT